MPVNMLETFGNVVRSAVGRFPETAKADALSCSAESIRLMTMTAGVRRSWKRVR